MHIMYGVGGEHDPSELATAPRNLIRPNRSLASLLDVPNLRQAAGDASRNIANYVRVELRQGNLFVDNAAAQVGLCS